MDPFLGEIRLFAGNFAPQCWALCNGAVLSIAQNTALFALLGTAYGGNGKTTFALPNLQGSVAMDQGQGLGLSPRVLGETGGTQTELLFQSEMPAHNHLIQGSTEVGAQKQPAATEFLAKSKAGLNYQSNTTANLVTMNPQMLTLTANAVPHNNMQPFLTLTYIIALEGIFPARG